MEIQCLVIAGEIICDDDESPPWMFSIELRIDKKEESINISLMVSPTKIPYLTCASLSEGIDVLRNKNSRPPLLSALTKFSTQSSWICNGSKIFQAGNNG